MVATKRNRILPKQRKAYARLKDRETRFILYGGAAGGGKSWLGCEWLMQCGYYLPGTRWFIGRNNLKDTRESVLVTWGKVAAAHNFGQYKYNDNGIRFDNGSEVLFLDLTYYPQKDPMFERLGSKEFTGGWIEEAGEVNFGAFDTLKTRVGRHLNAENGLPPKILITCNPKKNWLYKDFYKPWRAGTLEADKAFIPALPKDNDYLTEEYLDNLRSIQDKARKQRLLFGVWEYDDDPNSLIQYDAIVDAFNNDHVPEDKNNRYMTIDVAMQGSDLFVIAVWYGFVLADLFTADKSTGKSIIDDINRMRVKHQVRPGRIVYDADGVGSFIGGFIPGAMAFLNGSRPVRYQGDDESNYENLKAQC